MNRRPLSDATAPLRGPTLGGEDALDEPASPLMGGVDYVAAGLAKWPLGGGLALPDHPTTLSKSDDTLFCGDIINERYRIRSEVGRGGFGVVYAAEHIGTGQPVALKVSVRPISNAESRQAQRFVREARNTAALRHANTVRLFDIGQTVTGRMYLAMELVHGPSLESVLRECEHANRTLTQMESIGVAVAVLGSLSEAHGRGLVHRDLKPSNIAIDEVDGEAVIKVLDFGIARSWDSALTAEGALVGTPAYMSPEQCSSKPLDGRADLYSLGVILYRCVAGCPPFGGSDPMQIMYAHLHADVPDLAQRSRTPLDARFVAAVHKALAKNPGDRFRSAKEMRAELLQMLRSQPADDVAAASGGEPQPMAAGATWQTPGQLPRVHTVQTGPTGELPATPATTGAAADAGSAERKRRWWQFWR